MTKLNRILIIKSFYINFSQVSEVVIQMTHLIHLTDYIKFQMDKGHFVGMILVDLQKAFDTVDQYFIDET